jgi:DNA repair protein RadA/Sms
MVSYFCISPPPRILLWIHIVSCLLLHVAAWTPFEVNTRRRILIEASSPSPSPTTTRQCSSSSYHRFGTLLQHSRQDGEDYDDEEEEEDDDDPPEVNVSNFQPPKMESGFGRGRSSPSQRGAMGTSGKSVAQVYMCTNCGSESIQWQGRCPTCREWNTLQEFAVPRSTSTRTSTRPLFGGSSRSSTSASNTHSPTTWLDGVDNIYAAQRPISIRDVDLKSAASQRLLVPDDDELNNVLGGGFMKGSLLLLGGDPGVGKSTLALQVASQVANLSAPPVGIGMGPSIPVSSSSSSSSSTTTSTNIGPVWYVSGEETVQQIATRAERLQALAPQLFLLTETNLNVLAEQVVQLVHQAPLPRGAGNDDEQLPTTATDLPPSLLIVDSIQTMMCDAGGGSSPGGMSQVRECMALLLRLAKSTSIPILAIGHVTKTGDVAGPRMVEHMVDAVLYLEGSGASGQSSSGQSTYRWLRSQKNRFGSCQTVGLYEFAQGRLVPNPELDGASTLPLEDLEGCAMSISVEGPQRAMTVEVQALVTMSSASFGKKTVDGGGLSGNRLNLLLGVLQKHCAVFIGKSRDVYVNVVGGSSTSSYLKKQGATALDLAVAVALTSSLVSVPVRGDTAFLAQVGLLGELRSLASMEARLLQAQRMGFSRVIVAGKRYKQRRQQGMDILECPTLKQALELGLTSAIPKRQRNNKSRSTSSKAPESLDELELEDIILDDDEDDEEDFA